MTAPGTARDGTARAEVRANERATGPAAGGGGMLWSAASPTSGPVSPCAPDSACAGGFGGDPNQRRDAGGLSPSLRYDGRLVVGVSWRAEFLTARGMIMREGTTTTPPRWPQGRRRPRDAGGPGRPGRSREAHRARRTRGARAEGLDAVTLPVRRSSEFVLSCALVPRDVSREAERLARELEFAQGLPRAEAELRAFRTAAADLLAIGERYQRNDAARARRLTFRVIDGGAARRG